MKCFSLTSYGKTKHYDSQILPLIRQMINLEELLLYISVCQRSTFIDGVHLKNEILIHMPRLQKFTFNIITFIERMNNEMNIQSDSDIRRTFVNWRYGQVGSYVIDKSNTEAQSHIYSLPYDISDMHGIGNSFPGGLFTNVRILYLVDDFLPFEHAFFLRIARSFPLITHLTVLNNQAAINTESQHLDHTNKIATTVVEFLHLTSLTIHFQKIANVEQFLVDTKTCLPSLVHLTVSYKNLIIVTENFTRDATRLNCSKVETLKFTTNIITAHSENFYVYFPCLRRHF